MTRPLAMVLVALLLMSTACTRRNTELGAGPDVSVCVAFVEMDSFDEPSPSDRADLLRWGRGMSRVLERVDLDLRIGEDRTLPTDQVGDAVDTLQDEVGQFVEQLDGGSESALQDALARLTAPRFSATYNTTLRSLQRACR